jgi:uncharacterized OsmC-like protein
LNSHETGKQGIMAEQDTTKEYAWQGRQFSQEVVTITDKGLRNQGIIIEPGETSHFEVFADEGARLGGDNTAPRPLTYFLLSAGFCTLTQLHRYSEMMKITLRDPKVTVRSGFRTDGSVLRGTVKASTVGFEVEIEVESDDPPERVAACIQAAENGCFVMQTVIEPTEVKRTVRLNGETLDMED